MIANLIILTVAAQLVSLSPDSEAPHVGFSLLRDSLVVVPVYLNGQGPYRFLLDTGATHSILSSAAADQLRISSGRSGSLITAGGSIPVVLCVIDVVQIGPVRLGK